MQIQLQVGQIGHILNRGNRGGCSRGSRRRGGMRWLRRLGMRWLRRLRMRVMGLPGRGNGSRRGAGALCCGRRGCRWRGRRRARGCGRHRARGLPGRGNGSGRGTVVLRFGMRGSRWPGRLRADSHNNCCPGRRHADLAAGGIAECIGAHVAMMRKGGTRVPLTAHVDASSSWGRGDSGWESSSWIRGRVDGGGTGQDEKCPPHDGGVQMRPRVLYSSRLKR